MRKGRLVSGRMAGNNVRQISLSVTIIYDGSIEKVETGSIVISGSKRAFDKMS